MPHVCLTSIGGQPTKVTTTGGRVFVGEYSPEAFIERMSLRSREDVINTVLSSQEKDATAWGRHQRRRLAR